MLQTYAKDLALAELRKLSEIKSATEYINQSILLTVFSAKIIAKFGQKSTVFLKFT